MATWQMLDVGSIWLKEFATALNSFTPVASWVPEVRNFGWLEGWEREVALDDPRLRFRTFPLQRGYSRGPLRHLYPMGSTVVRRLLARTPEEVPLICTSPFYAPVAERWPGPVVYYLTDLTIAYEGMDRDLVQSLDQRLCRIANLICPNSRLTGEYLVRDAGCERSRLLIIPNATRSCNILAEPLNVPESVPADVTDLPRPIVGVIGNLASNLDWNLIRDAVDGTRDCSWLFVGPVSMKIDEPDLRSAREDLMQRGGRVRFIGSRPYSSLKDYARAFDVALLPYRKKESTFSGSATRFYEHLAACRPILATPAVDELLSKEPLLKLVSSGAQVTHELECLRAHGFQDGWEWARWRASHDGTWEARAQTMLNAVAAAGHVPEPTLNGSYCQ